MLRIGYTVPEVAKALGVSDSAVYRMVETGVLRRLEHTQRVIIGRLSLIAAFGDDAAAAIDADVVVTETDDDEIRSAA